MKAINKRRIYRDALCVTWSTIALEIILTCAENLLSVLTVGILGEFADAVFALNFDIGAHNLLGLASAILAMVVLIPGLSFAEDTIMLTNALVHDRMLLSKYLDKKFLSATAYEPGDIQHRLEWDAIDLRWNLMEFCRNVVFIPVTVAFLLHNALRISPVYTLIAFAVSLFKLTVPAAVRKLHGKYDRQTREYQARVRAYETEMITGQPCMVSMMGLKAYCINRLDQIYREYFRSVQRKSIRCNQTAGAVSSLLDTLCTLTVLLTGAALTAADIVTPGAVAAMTGYYAIMNTVVSSFGDIIRNTPVLKNSAERMSLFYEDAEKTDGAAAGPVSDIFAVRLSYAYGDKTVFQEVSFDIEARSKTAVCGPNGCGKSTLVKLICGLLDGYGGSLQAGDEELSGLSPEQWRRQISYVPQNPYLFSGSVRENIRLGNLSASDAQIDEVMDKIGIAYLAEREISPGGSELSGGEKQKTAVARALIKDTPILILDEPSNAMDHATHLWLEKFIRESDKTILFVSHDEALTSCADHTIVLCGKAQGT